MSKKQEKWKEFAQGFFRVIGMLVVCILVLWAAILVVILTVSLSWVMMAGLSEILTDSISWVWGQEIWDQTIVRWISDLKDIIIQHKNRYIIAIVILITVAVSFLLRKKGIEDIKKYLLGIAEKIGEVFLGPFEKGKKVFSTILTIIIKYVFVLVNFVFHIVARFLLLFVILAIFRAVLFLFPLLATLIKIVSINTIKESWMPTDWIKTLIDWMMMPINWMMMPIDWIKTLIDWMMKIDWIKTLIDWIMMPINWIMPPIDWTMPPINVIIITLIFVLIISVVSFLFFVFPEKILKKEKKEKKEKEKTERDINFLSLFRFMLVFTILVLATLPVLFYLYPQGMGLAEKISDDWSSDQKVITAFASIISAIGLASILYKKHEKKIKKSLWGISDYIGKVFQSKWQKPQWCYIAEIPSVIKQVLLNTLILFLGLWAIFILLFFLYLPIKAVDGWQNDVENTLDTIKTETANLMILRSSGHSPAYLSSTGKDTISFFSLAYLSKNKDEISFLLGYPYQGNLESKKGICPADSSLNLAWLKFFKKAFSACAEDSLKLKIQGFASAAPVAERDSSKYQKAKSDTFNCEIANQRAEALIYFLMLPNSIRYTQERCKAYLDSSRIWGRVENKLCIRKMIPDTAAYKEMGFDVTYKSRPSHIPMCSDSLVMKLKRLGFEVAYEPWQSCGEMSKAKPVQDSLRLDLEFLNRSVKITIEGDSCLTKAVSIPDTNSRAGH